MATSALSAKSEQQSPQHHTPTKASPSSSTTMSVNQQSPRNTPSSALPTGTYVSFGPVEVSKALQDGEKFVKWDEVCSTFYNNTCDDEKNKLRNKLCHKIYIDSKVDWRWPQMNASELNTLANSLFLCWAMCVGFFPRSPRMANAIFGNAFNVLFCHS